jgi:hypothetical protein
MAKYLLDINLVFSMKVQRHIPQYLNHCVYSRVYFRSPPGSIKVKKYFHPFAADKDQFNRDKKNPWRAKYQLLMTQTFRFDSFL